MDSKIIGQSRFQENMIDLPEIKIVHKTSLPHINPFAMSFARFPRQTLFRAHLAMSNSPFALSPRSAEKIRSGKFDLRRDLPMDAYLELRLGERGTEDEFEILSRYAAVMGFEERGQSRFVDRDLPFPLFG